MSVTLRSSIDCTKSTASRANACTGRAGRSPSPADTRACSKRQELVAGEQEVRLHREVPVGRRDPVVRCLRGSGREPFAPIVPTHVLDDGVAVYEVEAIGTDARGRAACVAGDDVGRHGLVPARRLGVQDHEPGRAHGCRRPGVRRAAEIEHGHGREVGKRPHEAGPAPGADLAEERRRLVGIERLPGLEIVPRAPSPVGFRCAHRCQPACVRPAAVDRQRRRVHEPRR